MIEFSYIAFIHSIKNELKYLSEDDFFTNELFDLYVWLTYVVEFDVAALLKVVLFGYFYFIHFFSFLWKSFCFGQRFLQVVQWICFLLFVMLFLYYNIFRKFDWLEAKTNFIWWFGLVFSRIVNSRFISACWLLLILLAMPCSCILLWTNTVQNLLPGFLYFLYFFALFLQFLHIDISQTLMPFGFAITICVIFLLVFLALCLIILVEAEFHWVRWLWDISFLFSIVYSLVTYFIIYFYNFIQQTDLTSCQHILMLVIILYCRVIWKMIGMRLRVGFLPILF